MKINDISFNKVGYLTTNISCQFNAELNDIFNAANSESEVSWTYIYKYAHEQKDLPFTTTQHKIDRIYSKCFNDFCKNEFSFFFRRLLNEGIEDFAISEASKKAYAFCNSDIFKNLIENVTGRNIGDIDVFYINRFDRGCFLNTHTDRGENIGIAINITKSWDPNFGGLTHILDESRKNVIETLTPKFGEMFIFDVSEMQVPHFVSMVAVNSKDKRMSIIARYGKAKING